MKIFVHNAQESLFQFSKKLAIAHYKLEKEFPQWKENDARIAVYGRCSNIAEQVLCSHIFENEQLSDKKWWAKITYVQPPTDSEIKTQVRNYDSFLRVSLVTQYFAAIETFFRVLIKKIFPEFKGSKFYLICKKILEEFDLKAYQTRFDLYRFTRNSLHEGIVTDIHVYPIEYNDKLYTFEQGKHIQVDWLMLCQLSMELEECLNKIVHSKKITDLDIIEDPSYFDTDEEKFRYYKL